MLTTEDLIKYNCLPEDDPFYSEVQLRHKKAVREGKSTYIDPQTELTVFTSLYLLERKFCCGSGCRHCPYNGDDLS